MGCCYSCPRQGTVEFIERFGEYKRVAHPGLNCINCLCGEGSAGKLSLRVQQLDVQCETKTKDNVFVTLVASVQFQVDAESLYDAFYKLSDPRGQMSSYIFDIMRSSVPKMVLDDVFMQKEEIAQDIKESLAKSMGPFGYVIIKALVNDIRPAAKVKEAMNEINAAQRLRAAALEKAEAQKVTLVKAAEAEAEAKHLQGLGVARQRQAIINGLHESVKDFSDDIDVSSKDVLQLMLMTQYFDTMAAMSHNSHSNTVFVNHSPGELSNIAAQMRGAFMEGSAGASASAAPTALPSMQR